METTASFGYWLRRRRRALDLTQAQLAEQVSCSLELIRKIEADARRPSRHVAGLLADRLGLIGEERAAFVQAARAERSAARLAITSRPIPPPDQEGDSSGYAGLPAPPTPLVGRDREVALLCDLLREPQHRLVTLTGPGGVGKTRIALQAAEHLAEHFADGVCFIDLAPVRDHALVVTAVAQALGVPTYGARPVLARLREALRRRAILLAIDNFEQVLAAAPLVAELLAAGPGVKALVTSRVALSLRGEHELPVEPLPLADPRRLPPPEALAQYAAVALLIQRAEDACPGFTVSRGNAAALAEICVRLDGLPLAIELAATRLKHWTPEGLLARLKAHLQDGALQILVGGPRDLPARQRTLRDTIAWSYNLLDPAEQAVFRRLGVFVGGCTAAAVAALCPEAERAAEGAQLEALADDNLLRAHAGARGDRYVLLETIREYAWELLAAAGELPALRRRHAEYFLEMAEQTAQALRWGRRDMEREECQAEDLDNLRAALDWALEQPGEPALHLRLGSALKDFWWYRGLLGESRRWREVLLAMPDPGDPALMARALVLAADMTWGQGESEQTWRLVARGLPLAEAAGDPELIAFAYAVLGKAAGAQGDYQAGAAALERSLAGFQALGHRAGVGWALHYLGEYTSALGDEARADAAMHAALEHFIADANFGGVTEATIRIAERAIERGDLVRAALLVNGEGWADQGDLTGVPALAAQVPLTDPDAAIGAPEAAARAAALLARSAGALAAGRWLPFFYGPLFYMMGRIALLQEDAPRARIFFAAYLRDYLATGANLDYALGSLEGLGLLREPPERGARLLGAAARLRADMHAAARPAWQATRDQLRTASQAQSDAHGWAAAWAAGAALTLDQAIEEALGEEALGP